MSKLTPHHPRATLNTAFSDKRFDVYWLGSTPERIKLRARSRMYLILRRGSRNIIKQVLQVCG